jgi:hypothetical protein
MLSPEEYSAYVDPALWTDNGLGPFGPNFNSQSTTPPQITNGMSTIPTSSGYGDPQFDMPCFQDNPSDLTSMNTAIQTLLSHFNNLQRSNVQKDDPNAGIELPSPSWEESSPSSTMSHPEDLFPVPQRARPAMRRMSKPATATLDDTMSKPLARTSSQSRTKKLRAHSKAERRYRDKLAERFNELRECIPALQTASHSPASQPSGSSDDEGEYNKINKATILTESIKYIRQLQSERNQRPISGQDWSVPFSKYGSSEILGHP